MTFALVHLASQPTGMAPGTLAVLLLDERIEETESWTVQLPADPAGRDQLASRVAAQLHGRHLLTHDRETARRFADALPLRLTGEVTYITDRARHAGLPTRLDDLAVIFDRPIAKDDPLEVARLLADVARGTVPVTPAAAPAEDERAHQAPPRGPACALLTGRTLPRSEWVALSGAAHDDPLDRTLRASLGTVLFPPHPPAAAPAPAAETLHWATLAVRLLQRGTAPPLTTLDRPVTLDATGLARALVGTAPAHARFDPDTLHPTYEAPTVHLIERRYPQLVRFLVPQARLADLLPAGHADPADDRRVDLAVCVPGHPPLAIELDGAQHTQERDLDRSRDAVLTSGGVTVVRVGAADLRRHLPDELPPAVAQELERRTLPRAGGAPAGDHIRSALAPIVAAQCAYTLVRAALDGTLAAGADTWQLAVADPAGLAPAALPDALTLLHALDRAFGAGVVPDTVHIGDHRWDATDPSLLSPDASQDLPPDLRLVIDPWSPATATPSPPPDTVPTWTLRTHTLPGRPRPDPELSTTPRPLTAQPETALRTLLRLVFGHDRFRHGQLAAVRRVLDGNDTAVLLPTGAGKSLIYQLSGLLRPGTTLVVAPLTALIDDQVRRLREQGIDRTAGLHAAGSRSPRQQLDDVDRTQPLVLFVTPERLQTSAFREALAHQTRRTPVNLAVVDEAHCVSEWGHDFRTSYLRLGANLRTYAAGAAGAPPLLALTATASPAVLRDMLVQLELHDVPGVLLRPDSFDRPNLTFETRTATPATWRRELEEIVTVRYREGRRPGVVFTSTVGGARGAANVASLLEDGQGGRVAMYAGSPPRGHPDASSWPRYRREVAHEFLTGRTDVLVATKAFGMGIDKPDIRHTVHLGLPSSIEAFAQEAGRAGRDGNPAHCVLITVRAASDRLVRRALSPDGTAADRAALDGTGDDISTQLYFHGRTFAGYEPEYRALTTVLDTVASLPGFGPHAQVKLAFPGGARADTTDRCLHRLVKLGFLRDYTVEHGRRCYELTASALTSETLDHALLEQVQLLEPARVSAARRSLEQAPSAPAARAAHHARGLLAMLYRTVGPSRLRALAELYDLATTARTDTQIRERIEAYLSEGPMAGVLLEVATSGRLDVRGLARQTDLHPPTSPFEWIGASGRLLQTFPNHPLLLAFRALAELLRDDAIRTTFRVNLDSALAELARHDASPAVYQDLFSWLTTTGDLLGSAPFEWRADLLALWCAHRPVSAQLATYARTMLDERTTGRTVTAELAEAALAVLLIRPARTPTGAPR